MKFRILNRKLLYCYIAILLITILGGFLRFYNLNWDEGHFFHPDERNIAMAVSKIHFFDHLNPEFFAYGSLPIYLYRAIGDILVTITKNPAWTSDWAHINLVGRGVSALFSTLTIILVFLLGKKIWNGKIGLLAAFLTAFAVSLIQTAHYSATESLLVFWLILLTLFSLEIAQKSSVKNYLKAGVILGLAMATKISAISFLIIPTIAQLLNYFRNLKSHLKFLFFLLLAFLTFSLFSPYAFWGREKFLESMNYETGVSTGRLKVVYTLQFEKTFPYLFQIKNFFWQIGPVAALGILGPIILLVTALGKRDKKLLIFLSFPLIYFLYVGSWHTKFIRYMVPVLPFLILFAAWFLILIQKRWPRLGTILISLTLLSTLFWAIAFFSIYTRPQTRITASRWIYQNIPKGAKILSEHWDDGLPIPLKTGNPSQYQIEALTIYEPDNEQKVNYYAQKLAGADYLILASRRLYGTLINLPEKYPLTSHYYQLLFSEKLGYTQIAEFTSYPTFLGITINDDSSEETFQVYDHPKVIIFRKTINLTQKQLENILER